MFLSHTSSRCVFRPYCIISFNPNCSQAITRIHQLPTSNEIDHREAIIDATKIHSGIIIAAALRKDFSGPEWKAARRYARAFLLELLGHNVEQIQAALTSVTSLEAGKPESLPRISSSYGGLWEAIRKALTPDDADGYDFYLQAVAKSSLVSPMDPSKLSPNTPSLIRPKLEAILKTVNSAILAVHKGFDDIILRFVGTTSEVELEAFCGRTCVAPLLVTLLLSPIKPLTEGAQTLVGQAYNADERAECIRALLEKQCDPTLTTMISQLNAFNKNAVEYPEAVEAAKMLVKCFTDILNDMCDIDHGLLFDEKFKMRNRRSLQALSQLWQGMCNAAGIIIERTPEWATRYHSGDMTPWMRDALIFGSELVEKRRVFEAALTASHDNDTNFEETDQVQNLSAIMRPLASWLRLSHQELLDLSYKLLMDLFDAFKETKCRPDESLLRHMERVVRKLGGKGGGVKVNAPIRTKLSSAQLGTLERRIENFEGFEDSDIEFVSQTFSPKKVSTVPVARPSLPSKKPVQAPLVFKVQSSRPLPTTTVKTNVAGKFQKGVSGIILSRGLDAQMVQSAIAERKAAKAKPSAVSAASSSSGGEHPSSSSESESDEDNAPSGLAQLSKLQKSPVKQQRQERRRAILLNDTALPPRTGKINQTSAMQQQRQLPRQQTRYIPDMTPLHRIVLGWNYDYDGPEPQTSGGPLNLKAVPNSFSSYRQYLDIMHPLLIVECWNSLVKSKEESLEKVQLVIAGKMHADFWVEIDAVIDQSVSKGWMLFETDIILMEHAGGRKALAKVHSARQTRQGIQATIRYSAELGDPELERAMAIQSSWLVSRVFRYVHMLESHASN